jgi:hypothetical protein
MDETPVLYTQVREMHIACVPPEHPWFDVFAVVVRNRGVKNCEYEVILNGQSGFDDDSAELPGEPLVAGSYGPIWRERFTTEAEAIARARAVAPRVTAYGYTWDQAMPMVFDSSEGVWPI